MAAGLRLAVLLGGEASGDIKFELGGKASSDTELEAEEPFRIPEEKPMAYWLNLSGNVRHNSSCKWYEKTKRGRACTADEGRPCGQCGG